MRQVLKLFVPLLLPAFAFAQTVYRVPADTKGNTIVLTIANESATAPAGMLTVRPVGTHAGVSVSPKSAVLKSLAANSAADVSFSFDVGREIEVNGMDTLYFEILDGPSIIGTKFIIIRYSGPEECKLAQNFPNPFNPVTRIRYDLPTDSRVSIAVYDVLGREVARPVNETKETGYHSADFYARDLASGAYIYRLVAQPVAGGKTYMCVKKLMVLR